MKTVIQQLLFLIVYMASKASAVHNDLRFSAQRGKSPKSTWYKLRMTFFVKPTSTCLQTTSTHFQIPHISFTSDETHVFRLPSNCNHVSFQRNYTVAHTELHIEVCVRKVSTLYTSQAELSEGKKLALLFTGKYPRINCYRSK